MTVKLMADLDLRGKRVLIREDLNVPVKDGRVTSDARLLAALPTIRLALDGGARLLVMSHLGRPKAGASEEENAPFSLAPVAARLSQLLGRPVPLVRDWLDGVEIAPGPFELRLRGRDARLEPRLVQPRDHLPGRHPAAFGQSELGHEAGHVEGQFGALRGPQPPRETQLSLIHISEPTRPY